MWDSQDIMTNEPNKQDNESVERVINSLDNPEFEKMHVDPTPTKPATTKMPTAITNRGGYEVVRIAGVLGAGGFSPVYEGILTGDNGIEGALQILAEHCANGEVPASILGLDFENASSRIEISKPEFLQRLYDRAHLIAQKISQDKELSERTIASVDPVLLENPAVAIKMLHSSRTRTPGDKHPEADETSLYKEDTLLRRVGRYPNVHPNVVRGFTRVTTTRGPVLLEERIDGPTLEEYQNTQENRRLGYEESARIALGINEGAGYLHKFGVIHRDLKPANILIERKTSNPKIIDFNISKDLNQTGTQAVNVKGTPGYIAPELVAKGSNKANAQSDMFSVGLIFYELLTGVPLYPRTADEFVKQILEKKNPGHAARQLLPYLSDELERFLNAAIAEYPDLRLTNEQFKQQLQHIMSKKLYERPKTISPASSSKNLIQRLSRLDTIVTRRAAERDAVRARLHYCRINEKLDEIENSIKAHEYSEAYEQIDVLNKELRHQPVGVNSLIERKSMLEDKINHGLRYQKARILIKEAEKARENSEYVKAHLLLLEAEPTIAELPKNEFEETHDAYKAIKDFPERRPARGFNDYVNNYVKPVIEGWNDIERSFKEHKIVEVEQADKLIPIISDAEEWLVKHDPEKVGKEYERTNDKLHAIKTYVTTAPRFIELYRNLRNVDNALKSLEHRKSMGTTIPDTNINAKLNEITKVEMLYNDNTDTSHPLHAPFCAYASELRIALENLKQPGQPGIGLENL